MESALYTYAFGVLTAEEQATLAALCRKLGRGQNK